VQIPVNFVPRWYQAEALRALESGIRLAVWCWSRRGGKDKTAFTYAVNKMVEAPMNVVLVFPTKEQGRKSFWNNIENDGFKTLDAIPEELIASKRDDEMLIRLINGSTFQVLGTKDPDALRGANGKLYIFSEFVDIDSAAYDVVIPIIEVNGGQVIIQSTPKIDGISGGTFKIMYDRALENWATGDKSEYASLITAKEYLSEETLERIRQDTIAKNGNDFWFQQEFMCNWGQASSTSYYGQVLKLMEEKGRIGVHKYDDDYPVYTAWDLGMSDSTAIVFFQHYLNRTGQSVTRIIDYYESHNLNNESHVKFVQSKPYNLCVAFLPSRWRGPRQRCHFEDREDS
jgi:phage terminase large subunit